jgi:hypothetical protein
LRNAGLGDAQSLQLCRTQTQNYPYLLLNFGCKTETMYHQATYITAASHGYRFFFFFFFLWGLRNPA